jgi:hypothetical protein
VLLVHELGSDGNTQEDEEVKFRVTFKTPDVMDYALQDIPEDEQDAAKAVSKNFIKYGEYLTVEIDTEAGTCVGIPV